MIFGLEWTQAKRLVGVASGGYRLSTLSVKQWRGQFLRSDEPPIAVDESISLCAYSSDNRPRKNEMMKRWLNLKTFGWTCTTVGLIGTIFYSQNLITPASVLWFIANSSFTVYNLVQEKPQIAQAVFFLVNAILNAIQLMH